LPGKGTESAKRHKIERAAKIAKIDSMVRQEILEAGLADSPTKIAAIASEPDNREWKPSKKWTLAWDRASDSEQKQFVVEVMGLSLDE
jgi:5-methylcytosine-specific restriction endonuclease McrBC GTP-binding regulatory subunit McrB